MIIMKPIAVPVPYEYGYSNRQTGYTMYGRPREESPPHDPQWNTHGEAGYYYDTMLGTPREGIFAKLRRKMLGDPVATSSAPASTEDVIATLVAHNDRLFALTVVSTTAVAVSAILTVFRTLKLIREGKRGD